MRRTADLLVSLASVLSLAAVGACASGSSTGDDVAIDAARIDARPVDAADQPIDAPTPVDAAAIDAAPVDATATDAAPPTDAAPIDAATPIDAAMPVDAMPIDGGTTTAPDTCAQAQNITAAAATPTGTTITGNTTGAVDDVTSPTGTCTGYTPDGPDHVYMVTLNAGQMVTATATPTTSWDISVELVTPCGLTPTCLAGADASASAGAETASYTAAAAQTVYVIVDSWSAGVAGPYSLLVRIQ